MLFCVEILGTLRSEEAYSKVFHLEIGQDFTFFKLKQIIMNNEELLNLIKEIVKQNITKVENGEKHIKLIGLGIYTLISLLEELGFKNNTEYLETNGCDMDFNYDLEKNSEKYSLWGSLPSDGYMFAKET